MNLVSVSIESIRIGLPLPFALRDEDGTLLANKGFVVGSRDDLEVIRGRGRNFYIDVDESDSHKRAFVGKLYELVNDESTLGEIAEARITTTDLSTAKRDTDNDPPDWLDMQVQANALLRELAASSRQLSRVLGDLESNPQMLLFGRNASQPGPGESGYSAPARRGSSGSAGVRRRRSGGRTACR